MTVLALGDDRRWAWAGTAVPLVAWSRVRVGHHTVPQVALGPVLGLTTGAFVRGR